MHTDVFVGDSPPQEAEPEPVAGVAGDLGDGHFLEVTGQHGVVACSYLTPACQDALRTGEDNMLYRFK